MGDVFLSLLAIVWVARGLLQVGRVEPGVEVLADPVDATGEEVIRGLANFSEDGGFLGLAGGIGILVGVEGSDLQIGELELGVAETEAELVDGLLVILVEVAVVDENTFSEILLGSTLTVVGLGQKRSAVGLAGLAPGEWGLRAGVDAAVKNIGDTAAALLAGKTSPENGGDVLVVVPVAD